jgi:CRISPR-associated protein Cas1
VSYQRGQLVVCPEETPDQETTVPLVDVGTILFGLKTTIGGAVLQQMAEFDVVALVCDWKGVPVGGMYGWHDHGRVGARQKAQAEVTLPRRKNAWGQVVKAKVLGQAANLRLTGDKDWSVLRDLANSVRSGDPENIEAQAARYYWARVFGAPHGRVPGARVDNRNALLDYGYTVLRGHAVRAVLSAGLAPSLGIFHRGRANFFNLADDLIEPFRPAVDYVVTGLKPEMSVNHPSVKKALVRASSQAFVPDGRTVSTCLTDLAQQLGRYVEGDIDRLPVPAWNGPARESHEPGG